MTEQNNINYLALWLAHSQIKREFLEQKNLPATYPLLELLIAAQNIQGSADRPFTIGEIQNALKRKHLPHHPQTVYRTAKYLQNNGYIQPINKGRQWFSPHRYFITAKCRSLLYSFTRLIKKSSL